MCATLHWQLWLCSCVNSRETDKKCQILYVTKVNIPTYQMPDALIPLHWQSCTGSLLMFASPWINNLWNLCRWWKWDYRGQCHGSSPPYTPSGHVCLFWTFLFHRFCSMVGQHHWSSPLSHVPWLLPHIQAHCRISVSSTAKKCKKCRFER